MKEKVYHLADSEVTDAWTCPDGIPHVWTYRGKIASEYRCSRCSLFVKKAVLKAEVD